MNEVEFFSKYSINPDNISWAGSGDFGDAYYTGDGRVLKKTTSKSEFDLAKKLIDASSPLANSFVDYYAAENVGGEMWILMEEVDADNSEIEYLYREVEEILSNHGLPVQYIDQMDFDDLEDVDDEVKYFANELYGVVLAYRWLGISDTSDIRPENLGYNKKGELKAFDIEDRSMDEISKIVKKAIFERFNFNNNKDFVPSSEVANVAKKALQTVSVNDLTPDGGNDGTGKRKAQELSNREFQSHQEMKRMKAFFDKYRTAVEKERAAGKDGNTSGILQMWGLHGGDQGEAWVDAQLSSLNKQNNKTKQRLQQAGGAGKGKGMGIFSNPMDNSETRTHSAWSKVKNRKQNS